MVSKLGRQLVPRQSPMSHWIRSMASEGDSHEVSFRFRPSISASLEHSFMSESVGYKINSANQFVCQHFRTVVRELTREFTHGVVDSPSSPARNRPPGSLKKATPI